jgi:hypothetical protein
MPRANRAVTPLLTGAGALFGGLVGIALFGRAGALRAADFARQAFAGSTLTEPAGRLAGLVAELTLPPLTLALACAAIVGFLQVRVRFAEGTVERPRRQPSRMLTLALAASVVMVAVDVVVRGWPSVVAAQSATDVARAFLPLGRALFLRALVLTLAAGLGDWLWRRARLGAASPRRVRDEDEVDPRVRDEVRSRQRGT